MMLNKTNSNNSNNLLPHRFCSVVVPAANEV
jgi:hypothetical protein